jgi:hypothetical protein
LRGKVRSGLTQVRPKEHIHLRSLQDVFDTLQDLTRTVITETEKHILRERHADRLRLMRDDDEIDAAEAGRLMTLVRHWVSTTTRNEIILTTRF